MLILSMLVIVLQRGCDFEWRVRAHRLARMLQAVLFSCFPHMKAAGVECSFKKVLSTSLSPYISW